MKLNRTSSLLIALLTATVSFFAYWALGGVSGRPDAFWLAFALITSVIFHEMFHLIIMEWYGIKTHIIFGVITAISLPDESDARKLKSLSWNENSAILLAGVPGNLLLIILGLLSKGAGYINEKEFGQLCFINGNIILFDLIIPALADGSKVMRRLLGNAPREIQSMQRLAFGGVGFSILLLISERGNSSPSYWGLIFLADCWFGGRMGKWFRREVWPILPYGVTKVFQNKFGERPEEFCCDLSEKTRLKWMAAYMAMLAFGAGLKYFFTL